jgi:hypothetical protein
MPVMPETAESWSLSSLREKLVKIDAKVVSHGRCVTLRKSGIAVPRQLFPELLSLTIGLRASLALK